MLSYSVTSVLQITMSEEWDIFMKSLSAKVMRIRLEAEWQDLQHEINVSINVILSIEFSTSLTMSSSL